MKKLLKAVALATVMCMLLSTAAFATEEKLPYDQDNDTVTVNVMTKPNEQVVLLIVDGDVTDLADVTDAQIQFIDQKEANASGDVDFGAVAVKTPDSKVDVWVGYAGVSPRKLGDDIDLKKVENITIVSGTDAIITAHSDNGDTRGFAAAITVNIPESLTVSKMIWGFKLKGNDTDRFYSDPDKFDASQYENVAGAVQFAAAFELGSATENLEVEEVSAIFLTTDGRTHFTNEAADAPNKKKN